MVLKFIFEEADPFIKCPDIKMAVATYDDLREHPKDEFYVGLNDVEL